MVVIMADFRNLIWLGMISPLDLFIFIAGLGIGVLLVSLFFRRKPKAADEIREEESLYRQLFEQVSDSIIIGDLDGSIRDVNASLCALLGYSRSEILSAHISSFFDPENMKLDPLKYTSLTTGEHISNERPMRRKDGSVVWVDVNVKKSTENRIFAIVRDITERKRIEAELLESESKFRDLAEKSMVGFYITQDGKYQYVNRRFAEIFGYTPQELINSLPVENVIAEEDRHITLENIQARLDGLKDSVHYEVRGCRKDGSENVIEIFGNTTQYRGRPAIIGSVLDITDKKQAEQMLIREKTLSETIIRTLPGIFMIRNMEGGLFKWNENFEQITGWSPEEIIYSLPYSFIIPKDRERVKAIVQDLHQSGIVASIETEFIRTDGSTVPVYMTGTSFTWEGQQCVMASAIDVTRRRQAEQELSLSEQKYKLLFDSNPLPMFMASREDMLIVGANDAACALYGYTKDELLNMTLKDLKPEEDIGLLIENFNKDMFQPVDLGIRKHKKKDGSFVFVHVLVQDINYGGQAVRLTLSNDITQRLKNEEEIVRSRANLHSILNITDVGYVLFNKDFESVTFNQVAVDFGKREFKITLEKDKNILSYVSSNRTGRLETIISELRQGKPSEFERSYEQPDGSRNWYQIKLFPVIDSNTFLGVVISIEDISRRKVDEIHREKISADLMHRNQDLEQFTYIVSHNLRAPVANILGICNILKNDNLQHDARLNFERILTVSVEQLDSVIRDLNDILQASREVTERKIFIDFEELIIGIKSSIQNLIDEHSVQIFTDFKEINGTVSLRTYLHSIFYNLINNSIKFRKPGLTPAISISSHLNGKTVILNYKDNGIGIDLEKHGNEIFGLYNRFHSQVPGKGMGLYMVRTQVQLLGGNIRINSSPGEGTEFTIELPDSSAV
ncbi:PAS domain S-box protein [Flavihumibacter sp. R14]|nr:PAS domain S-box protein [Flavihumibacter soli]